MTIIQETREKSGKKDHILDYFQKQGISVIRSKLFVGDYTLINSMVVSVDVKQDIMEIQQNLMNKEKHKAFRDECDRAYANGIKLYVLIEEKDIKTIDDIANYKIPIYKSNGFKKVNGKSVLTHYKGQPMARFDPKTLVKVMKTFQEKHHCTFLFCDKDRTGSMIVSLLERGV